MLFCHNIHYILMINALFLPIFLGWKKVLANFFAFWMYVWAHFLFQPPGLQKGCLGYCAVHLVILIIIRFDIFQLLDWKKQEHFMISIYHCGRTVSLWFSDSTLLFLVILFTLLVMLSLKSAAPTHHQHLVPCRCNSGRELEGEVSNSFSRIKSNFPESPGLKVIFSRVSDKKRVSWNDKIKRNSHKIGKYTFQ